MNVAFRTLLALTVVLAVGFVAMAEDKKEAKKVTLKGELACAKCVLKEKGVTKCTNAITVEKDGKKTVYILEDKGGAEKYHKPICADTKAGSVTGVVSTKGGKNYIKPDADGVKFDE